MFRTGEFADAEDFGLPDTDRWPARPASGAPSRPKTAGRGIAAATAVPPRTPQVSVIVPAFNAEPYIRETLDSVLAQDYPGLEVIVSDDGSTDGTRECVRSYGARVEYVYGENSGGAARPRNEGLRVATGELIAFIDADDLMARGRLAAQVAFFARHPGVGIVFTDYEEFGADKREKNGHFQNCPLLSARLRQQPGAETEGLVLSSAEATELLLTENFGSSAPMVRREAIDRVGGYDETAIPSEDFEFSFRVAAAYPVGIVPRIDWRKRQHPSNLSANTPRVLRQKIAVRERLLAAERSRRRRRKLKQRIATWHADLAYYYTGRDNALALRHALNGLAFDFRPRPRLLLRLALDLAGRDSLRGARA